MLQQNEHALAKRAETGGAVVVHAKAIEDLISRVQPPLLSVQEPVLVRSSSVRGTRDPYSFD